MTTLREAAQQALEALDEAGTYHRNQPDQRSRRLAAMATLRDALAQEQAEPVQEPVAWRYKPMAGSPWSLSDDGYYISCKRDSGYIIEPLYTAPPQRKPLTEEEITQVIKEVGIDGYDERYVFARAIEQAHGIGGQDES